jgi:hypothetical protein
LSREIASLSEVLADRPPGTDEILHRFIADFGKYGLSPQDAEELFLETKRWLWLCAYRKAEFEKGRLESVHIPLASESNAIDLMWHTFLLFTKNYADFCDRHFGFFIHHYPTPQAEKLKASLAKKADPVAYRATRAEALKPAYRYIYDVLGRETLIRWMEDFPKRYRALMPPE